MCTSQSIVNYWKNFYLVTLSWLIVSSLFKKVQPLFVLKLNCLHLATRGKSQLSKLEVDRARDLSKFEFMFNGLLVLLGKNILSYSQLYQ